MKRPAPEAASAALHPAAPASAALQALVDTLLQRHGTAVNGILFYGSCLRSGDLFDGLADLYLIVDSYPACYRRITRALANWLLPPNVFYTEMQVAGRTLRAKYAVLSTADLVNGTSRRWFHSYLWGRFSQPTALVWSRDASAQQRIDASREQAVATFLTRVLPVLPPAGRVHDLWQQGLQLSYAAELRAERPGRAAGLTATALDYYLAATRCAAASLPFPVQVDATGDTARYLADVPAARRFLARIGWPVRKFQGKLLSVLRLMKALFTFEGGLDYIAWKLERHSGQPIEIPERVRRHPLIFVWGLFWRLYRRGIFR